MFTTKKHNIAKPNKKLHIRLKYWCKYIFNRLDVSNGTIVRNNDYANTLTLFASRLIILSQNLLIIMAHMYLSL
jgi:hypothetical protein